MAVKPLLFIIASLGLAKGLLVGPVRLASMEAYIDYQMGASEEVSLIECPVKLERTEELQEVSWIFYEGDDNIVGRYFWTEESGGKAEGRLIDAVRLDREDGGLQLTELKYELSGFYSCSVTTVDGTSEEAAKWEVLIVDQTAKGPMAESMTETERCMFRSTFKLAAIFPEPTVHSGLYSDSLGGFHEEVEALEWKKREFDNKSFTYSHENVLFEINEQTPIDVYFMNSVGIQKKDGTYISLKSTKTVLHDFEERGCPAIKAGAYQQIDYNNGNKKSCRGEILPPGAGPLKATVQCTDGYKPIVTSNRETLELGCSTKSWEWGVPNDYPSLSHITCVVDDSSAITNSASTLFLIMCSALVLFFRL